LGNDEDFERSTTFVLGKRDGVIDIAIVSDIYVIALVVFVLQCEGFRVNAVYFGDKIVSILFFYFKSWHSMLNTHSKSQPTIKIKVVQNKDIRVWKYPSHRKYQSLLAFVTKVYGIYPEAFTLQYEDDEGDNINIRNDRDIDDAISFAKDEGR
jgi:hypothetical protein